MNQEQRTVNIELGDKALTISSMDPNDPNVVATTVIEGKNTGPTVRFSGRFGRDCLLDGLTIQSEGVGISCNDATPTIRRCTVNCPNGIAVEFWHNQDPQFIECTVLGQVREGGDPGLIAYWEFDETEGSTAYDSEGNHDAMVTGVPAWQPIKGAVGGALEFDGMTSVVISRTMMIVSQIIFVMIGVVLLLYKLNVSGTRLLSSLVIILLGVPVIMFIIFVQKHGLFAFLLKLLGMLRIRIRYIEERKERD